MNRCDRIREWLSADRDGEAVPDPAALEHHLRSCAGCRAWLEAVDGVTAPLRVSPARAPDQVVAALSVWDELATSPGLRGWRAALVVAGLASIAVAVLQGLGLGPASGHGHGARDLAAFDAALGAAFLFAAWRPDRFAAALAPLAVILAGLLMVVVAVDVATGRVSVVAEMLHLPTLVGAVALGALAYRSRHQAGPPADALPVRGREGVPA
jgi:predicted anti-sigma-YlaC factor YlaD